MRPDSVLPEKHPKFRLNYSCERIMINAVVIQLTSLLKANRMSGPGLLCGLQRLFNSFLKEIFVSENCWCFIENRKHNLFCSALPKLSIRLNCNFMTCRRTVFTEPASKMPATYLLMNLHKPSQMRNPSGGRNDPKAPGCPDLRLNSCSISNKEQV